MKKTQIKLRDMKTTTCGMEYIGCWVDMVSGRLDSVEEKMSEFEELSQGKHRKIIF